jgi:DNA polymerase family A
MDSIRTRDLTAITEIPGLAPEHHQYLSDHAVSDDIITAQGIVSDGGVIIFPWRDGEQETLQRRPWPGESGQYLWEAGKPLHLNVILEAPGKPVLLAEGTKQSLAVASWVPRDEAGEPEYAVYGMPGCYGWVSKGNLDLKRFAGRQVLVMLDADAAENLDVYEAGERLMQELEIEDPPATAGFVPSPSWGKDGIDDYLARIAEGRRTDRLRALIGQLADKPAERRPRKRRPRPTSAPDTGGRALVLVNRDRREVIESILGALYAARWQSLFDFGGALTRIRGTRAEPLEKGPFLALLPQVAACYRYRDETATAPARYDPDCWPDNPTIDAVLSSADRFLELRRISRVPFAREDGTACVHPGYDSATSTLLISDLEMQPIPDEPDAGYVAWATGVLLNDWLGDMPFKNEASRANALALILTTLVRSQLPIVPLAVVSGLQPGVGKGLFGDCLSIFATGEPSAPLPYTPDDESETRKKITAAFMGGTDLFLFDEAHVIQGAELARAITSLTYQDRVLGASKTVQYPNQVTWVSLGNQVVVNADMSRRVYFIELSPSGPNPQDRDESMFAHPDLREWTRENRARLVHAALVLIRAWHAAGQPRHRRGALMGSFERWDKMMSDITGHAGVPGFLANLAERRAETDFSGGYWNEHIDWLAATFGTYPETFTALEVKTKAQASSGAWNAPPRLDDLMDNGFARKLGQAYARNQDRWYGSHRLIKVGVGHGTVVKWAIEGLTDLPPFQPPSPGPESGNGHGPSGSNGSVPSVPSLNGHTTQLNGYSVSDTYSPPSSTGENARIQDHATPPPVVQGRVLPNDPPVNPAGDGTEGTQSPAAPVVRTVDGTDGTNAPVTSPLGPEITDVRDGRDGTPIPSHARGNIFQDQIGENKNSYRGVGDIHTIHPIHPATPPATVSAQLSLGFADPEVTPEFGMEPGGVTSVPVSAGQAGSPVPAGNLAALQGTAVGFDLETGDSDQSFRYIPHDETGFIRLAGVIGPDGQPVITRGPRELLAVLDQASEVYGHNILGFDGLALAHHHGMDWERFAAKARDTELIARQANPPRSRGTAGSADKYDLDHVAAEMGLPGKTDDLKGLKRQHGGYDRIPLDDPAYRSYLDGDLLATKAVRDAQAARYPADPYLDREHKIASLAGRMTLNGFRVDQSLLEQRIEEGERRKQDALAELHDPYGLPLSRAVMRGRGSKRHEETEVLDSPIASKEGRAWVERVWKTFGITDPPRTDKGELAIGREALAPIAAAPGCHPMLARIIELMTIVTTTRTVYQTAAACLGPDGRVHPGNSFRQASGRWSVTNPGLTVFGKRGGRHHERDIFLPDEGHVLMSCDLSQVDMRSMAGHSQDQAYMAMFAPGRDAHTEIAGQVGLDRQSAKAIGHGWNYGLGVSKMIREGLDPEKVYAFVNGMENSFPRLIAWREEIRAIGQAGEILDNGFGRRMRAEPSRAYTVAPALMGQGGARDIMCQSLLQLPDEFRPYLRVMVHDEIVASIPADDAERIGQQFQDAMTWMWRSVPITCDRSPFGASWGEISAK